MTDFVKENLDKFDSFYQNFDIFRYILKFFTKKIDEFKGTFFLDKSSNCNKIWQNILNLVNKT